MELSPEVKKQLEEQKKNCPFCKIISGEIPSKKVYEDDKIVAILDINPAAAGHTLVMTKEHYPILPYITPEEFKQLFRITAQLASKIQEAMVTDSCNIFIANGYAAGQQSPHFMLHIIPREANDGMFLFRLEGEEIDEMKTEEAFKLLSNNLPIMMENHLKKDPQEWHKARAVGTMERKFTEEQVIGIIEQNPQLKQIIEKQPQALIAQVKTNEQLKMLFKDVDVVEVIKHFNPKFEPTVEDEFEDKDSDDLKNKEATDEDDDKEDEQEQQEEESGEETEEDDDEPGEESDEGDSDEGEDDDSDEEKEPPRIKKDMDLDLISKLF